MLRRHREKCLFGMTVTVLQDLNQMQCAGGELHCIFRDRHDQRWKSFEFDLHPFLLYIKKIFSLLERVYHISKSCITSLYHYIQKDWIICGWMNR